MSLFTLTELRLRAAAMLAPTSDDEPPVLQAPADAIEPPALMVAWDEPWLTAETSRYWTARLGVICFAGRVDPEAGVADLERLVAYVIGRLRADTYPWPHETTRAPALFEIGGIPLLAARLIYACPVSLGGT